MVEAEQTEQPAPQAGPRLAPLDGARAVFLAVVMAHHLVWAAPDVAAGWVPGAWAALDGFFVLSGFLIGGLLFAEQRRTGTIAYGTFVVRRVLRLYPAMVVAIAAMATVSLTLNDQPWRNVAPSVWAGALYVMNRPFGNHPFPDPEGPLIEYTHLWSLAVEFQFYLFLPLLLLVLVKATTSARTWAAAIVALMGLVWWNRTRMWTGPEAFPAAYAFTEARMDTLLWGVLLALAIKQGWLGDRHRTALRVAVVPAFAWTAWVVANLEPQTDAFVYDWGMTISGLANTVLLAWVLIDSTTLVASFLGSRPLTWLGHRSYSMYLYHYPVFFLVARQLSDDLTSWQRVVVALVATVAIAHASYTVVEKPTFKLKDRFGGRRDIDVTTQVSAAAGAPPPATPPAPAPLDR